MIVANRTIAGSVGESWVCDIFSNQETVVEVWSRSGCMIVLTKGFWFRVASRDHSKDSRDFSDTEVEKGIVAVYIYIPAPLDVNTCTVIC